MPGLGEENATRWDESGDRGTRSGLADGTFETGRLLLGKYRIGQLLGRGGMGSVYRATNERIRREFAIKVINAEVLDDISVARFRREAEAIAAVRHPNVVDIIDWETLPDGRPILVMEYVDGQSLKSRLTEGPMSFDEIHDIAGQFLDGLAAAHAAGITHRDLKPDNLMLSRLAGGNEVVKILDFGLARVDKSATITESRNSLIGTPSYMSPEQIDGRTHEFGAGTDMWAVGAVLYEMTTGRKAFCGENITSTLLRVMESTPEPISKLRPDAPPRLIRLIDRLLIRDDSRLASAVSARQLLDDALSDDPSRSASDLSCLLDSFEDAPRRRRPLRVIGFVVGALAGVGLGVAGFLLAKGDGEPPGASDRAAAVEAAPTPEPGPTAAPEPNPAATPMPEPAPQAAEPEPEQAAEPEPEQAAEPEHAAEPEQAAEPEPVAAASPAAARTKAPRKRRAKRKAERTEPEPEAAPEREFGDPLNPYR